MSYLEQLFSLAGKTAVVTGGSSGIGRMIAEALARGGAHVFVVSRKLDACERVAAEINDADPAGRVEALAADISNEVGIRDFVQRLEQRVDRLNILVNNAGKTWGAPLEEFPYEAWERVLSLNLTAPFALTQQLLPLLKRSASTEDPARVVNIGSIAGTQPLGLSAYSYAASKAGIHHITRILANELAAENVTVNALAPGPFEGRMMAFATSDPERRRRLIETVPLRRLGAATDVGAAMLYLCGGGGTYVTGAILPVDGGKHVAIPKTSADE